MGSHVREPLRTSPVPLGATHSTHDVADQGPKHLGLYWSPELVPHLDAGPPWIVLRSSAPPRRPRLAGHPVTVGPPTGERAERRGPRCGALSDERPNGP